MSDEASWQMVAVICGSDHWRGRSGGVWFIQQFDQ
jgi:hypothetical protein